jgi:competence protein ComEC
VFLFVSFLIGIVLFASFQYFPVSSLFAFFLFVASLSIKKKFFPLLFILLGIGTALLHYQQPKEVSSLSGKEAVVREVVQSFPIETGNGMFRQAIRIESAVDAKTGEKIRDLDNQEIFLLSHQEFRPGTECEIVIKFLSDRTRLNPGSFINKEIYAKLLEVNRAEQKKISLKSEIQRLRYKLNRHIQENFKKDSAAFIMAITTGQRSLMDEDLRNAFNATGLAHILSISGTHFGLLSVFVFSIFRLIVGALPYKVLQRITIFLTPSQAAALLSFPFMLAYFGLSGGSVPAVRSFIMISLFLLGLLIGRKGLWLNSLLFAACALTIWEPKIILDLSFQLSFLAVLFIGFAVETRGDKTNHEAESLEEKKFHPAASKLGRYLRNALFLTVSASVGTAPLVAYHFHYFSIISPLSNLLITPIIGFVLIPLSILSSFLFLITGHYVFTPVVSAVSDMSISLVRIFSSLPFADIKMPAFPLIIVLLFYAGFIFYLLIPGNTFSSSPSPPPLEGGGWGRGNLHSSLYQLICRNVSLRKRYTLIIPLVPLLIYFSLIIFERKELTVTYLDVGQGDSAVVELPDRKTIVIDTGRSGRETASYLKYIGKKAIDVLVLSHVHPDHTGGLNYLMKGFHVKEVWDNGRMILPETVTSYLRDNHRIFQRGDAVEGKGYNILAFHPYPEFYSMHGNEYVEANNDSLVIRIKGRNKSFLFTGDVEEEAEENLSSFGKLLQSDVIKVPHHGSRASAYKPFFEIICPQVAVISVGHDNSFGHPHDEMLDALQGVKTFRTDTDGAVKISESINGFKLKTCGDIQFLKARSFKEEKRNIKRLFETW